MGRVTVKALASAVGVSPSTVSNAYNRPDQLSTELRARILAKAEELGFSGPDAAGRALRVGRAEAVGVLLSERLSYAFSETGRLLLDPDSQPRQVMLPITLVPRGSTGPARV